MNTSNRLLNATTHSVFIALVFHLVSSCPALAEARPNIFGCGIVWGNWLNLPPEQAKEWDRRSMDKIVEMGGTNCPANFAWIDIEPQEGVFNWDYVDHQVAEANARGLEIFAYTGLTPDWALPPEAPDVHGIGYRYPPGEQYATQFESFFRTLAERYKGKVKYYEFWNEPNGCSWINDGCANGHMAYTYVPWLKRWYTSMKAGDPDCVLALGGLDYHSGVTFGYEYIEDVYDNGGGDYFDAVAIHPYGNPLHWQAIRDTYQVLVNHGDGHKKLWLNEYGWNTSDESLRASNLTTVLTELKKPEYDMVFQANYLIITDLPGTSDSGIDYGLCGRNTSSLELYPRQSWYAFRDLDKSFPVEDTPTPTMTPTIGPSPTPSATPTPDPTGNRLLNPRFEDGFVLAPPAWQNDPAHPRKWAVNWQFDGGSWWEDSGAVQNMYYSPTHCQSVGTDWSSLNNTIYQTVQVQPGTIYRLSAWTRADSEASGSDHIRRRIGVDPTGGTDPEGANVLHSDWFWTEEQWEQLSIDVTARDFLMTVFIQGETVVPFGWQWFYVDDVFLRPVESPTPTVTPTPAISANWVVH